MRYKTIENFDFKNYEICDLNRFNEIFDSEMVHLPTSMIAFGFQKNTFYMYNMNENVNSVCETFINYWVKNIHPTIHKSYYFVFNYFDGHRERIQSSNFLKEYYPKLDEFLNKQEISCPSDQSPILHKNKYILAYGKHHSDNNTITVINPYFINCKGFTEYTEKCEGHKNGLFLQIDQSFVSWKDKKNKCIFRGTMDYGNLLNFINPENHTTNQRKYLKQLYDEKKLDNIIDVETNYLSPVEQMQNKYLLDIDGNAACWDALPWKLYSGSVLLKHESVWEQYGYKNLKEWTHYVPIKNDFSDLNEKIEWCKNNDDECERISIRAREFVVSELNYDYVMEKFNKYIVNFV